MTKIEPIKSFLSHDHKGKGKLAYEYMKRGGDLVRDGPFPEEVGGVSALVNDHAIHLAHENHEFGVDLGHLFEILIMEIQIVVNFLLGENVFLYIFPVTEIRLLFLS